MTFAVPGTAFGLARGGVRAGGGISIASLFGADDGFYPCKPGYVFTDTAGTVGATTDGDAIACFKPQYGGLPWLVQATAGNRPTLKDAGGGIWYVVGDGTTDVWASASTITTSTEQLLAMALRRAAETAVEQFRVGTSTTNKHGLSTIGSLGRLSAQFRFSAGTQYVATSLSATFPLAADVVASSKLTATTIDICADQGTPVSAACVAQAMSSVQLTFPVAAPNADRLYGFTLYQGTVGTAERTTIVSALAALQGRSI